MGASARFSAEPAQGFRLPERYRVLRHIASGGMASVWCAEDRVLGRSVAVKVLAERFAYDPLAVRRFKREARAAARVSAHPHAVTIFDVGDIGPGDEEASTGNAAPARAFIVMEFLAGGTVADALRVGAVKRHEALRWLREAASALDHAHERGIVHRDIKPANFLLDNARSLHVADFGIARLASEETITTAGELFGTAAYLAPEQALGREATSACDRYALGVAAFELLTGERPFTASHFAAQARQHIESERPRASERRASVPAAADPVLVRAMAIEPTERYPTATAFVAALESGLGGAAIEDPMTTATTPSAVTPRRGSRAAVPIRPRSAPPRARHSTAPGAHRGPAAKRRPKRMIALTALLVALVGVAVLGILSQSGSGGSRRASASASAAARHRARHVAATHRPATASHSSSAAASTSTTTASATTTASSAAPSAAPTSAAGLQAQGHQQLADGAYPAAIATLRRAVAAADPSSLTYAYALYDLGAALLRSGDPQAAIPILQQRLKIPNQTSTVQALLNLALQAAGQAPAAPTGPAHGPAPDTGAGQPATGGAALPPGLAKQHAHGKRTGR